MLQDQSAMSAQEISELATARVTAVIPTLNEARNLPYVLARLPEWLHEVIIVDGHSVDGTLDTVRRLRPDARILMQSRRGKGNALACGFAMATGDIIVMIDADGSADPCEIPKFVRALLDGADFAKGTRFKKGGGSSDITLLRRFGNRALIGLVNVLCRTGYSDLCYGFNAFWREYVPVLGLDADSAAPIGSSMKLLGDGFEVETLINIRVARAGLTVREVASYEHPRIHGASNLNAYKDGMRVLCTIISERFYNKDQKAPSRHASVRGHSLPARPHSPVGVARCPPPVGIGAERRRRRRQPRRGQPHFLDPAAVRVTPGRLRRPPLARKHQGRPTVMTRFTGARGRAWGARHRRQRQVLPVRHDNRILRLGARGVAALFQQLCQCAAVHLGASP